MLDSKFQYVAPFQLSPLQQFMGLNNLLSTHTALVTTTSLHNSSKLIPVSKADIKSLNSQQSHIPLSPFISYSPKHVLSSPGSHQGSYLTEPHIQQSISRYAHYNLYPAHMVSRFTSSSCVTMYVSTFAKFLTSSQSLSISLKFKYVCMWSSFKRK